MLRIHYFQHGKGDGVGTIARWAAKKGHGLTSTKIYEVDWDEVSFEQTDLLIILGGSMSTYDEEKYPWLIKEKKWIQRAIKAGKVVLGICLGSQLVAEALGSRVYPNGQEEIGWFPVMLTEEAQEVALLDKFPQELAFFNWHGDTFDLPPNALHLAYSAGCRNQAFLYGDRVMGVQFHPELAEEQILEWIEPDGSEPAKAEYVQTREEILEKMYLVEKATNVFFSLLDKLEALSR